MSTRTDRNRFPGDLTSKRAALLAAALACAAPGVPALAGVILSPTAVTTDMGNSFSGAIGNTIDQSGLNTPFVSGVTDFDVYDPVTRTTQNFGSQQWWGALDTLGVTDFDLGADYNVTRLAFWNANNVFGMNRFRVLIDDDATFSSATDMGTFNALFANDFGQVFDLADATGRYVRFEHLSTHSNRSNMGEVAFEVDRAVPPVPEPGPLALLGAGALALASLRRRRRRA